MYYNVHNAYTHRYSKVLDEVGVGDAEGRSQADAEPTVPVQQARTRPR